MPDHIDILVAHPYKHHALHLAVGCARATPNMRLAVPLYRTGLGAVLAKLPGSIGRKAMGYHAPGLALNSVRAPLYWQLRKLWSLLRNPQDIEVGYDRYVARKISRNEWRVRVLVTLQDYMPLTMQAAKDSGALAWSDQISNCSATAMARVDAHHRAWGLPGEPHSESVNDSVLQLADMVTVPSIYTLQGLAKRTRRDVLPHIVPYGVDGTQFNMARTFHGERFKVVARANTVRKGGHLLLGALKKYGRQIVEALAGRRLEIVILGNLDPTLTPAFDAALKSLLPANGSKAASSAVLSHGNIPFADVPRLLADADLFVMPALSESMSLACLEAMQMGVPLLVTRYVGLDCFIPGQMGYEVEDDLDSVGLALCDALAGCSLANRAPANRALSNRVDPDHCASLSQWGLNAKAAVRNSTWKNYHRQIQQLARAALER